jgi:1-deoxy-D-xylulose-5-phosphate reductoisomerase
MACIMNGANEVAVDAFLKDRILFSRIPEIIEKTMEKATFVPLPDTDDIFASHAEAKEIATSLI